MVAIRHKKEVKYDFLKYAVQLDLCGLEYKVKIIKMLSTNISRTNEPILTKFDGQLTYHARMACLNFEG